MDNYLSRLNIYIYAYIIIPINLFSVSINSIIGFQSFYIILPLIFFTLVLSLISNCRGFKYSKFILLFFILNSLICFIHIIKFGFSFNEIKNYIYIIVFMLCILEFNSKTYFHIQRSIIILSLLISLDAIVKSGYFAARGYELYNVRTITFTDKPSYTFLLSLATIPLIDNLFKRKNAIISLIILLIFCYVNIIIIESKLYILSVLVITFLELKRHNFLSLKRILLVLIPLICITILFSYIYYDLLPDYIKIILSPLLGIKSDSIPSRKYETYISRLFILNTCINLIKTHFLAGIGFGNYSSYVISSNLANHIATQTESSFLNAIVEGGSIYFFTHITLLISIYKKQARGNIILSLLIIVMCVLNIANDYMMLYYWIILASIYKYGNSAINLKQPV